MKILNLSEGSFPIKFSIKLGSVEVPNIGKLQNELSIDAEIQKISKNLYRCAGQLKGSFEDVCQNCLKKTGVEISNSVNVTIKDLTEMHSDSSEQDQTHYQDLEYFDLHRFIEEELAIIYPDIVKCSENCLEGDITQVKEKNLPFKKIRDLIE
tara:strand:+ start:1962 stop:2420 length:459 start_codon:yes stop_codon:yes gene_type:complete